MVKFRMSMKGERGDAKPHHISIPQKDAIAIVPPKKVIKAIADLPPEKAFGPGYLTFSAGDFLHVVGRENDTEWYEACNPLQGARGLVPVKFFETVGKQARNSAGSTGSGGYAPVQGSAPHDSGYATGNGTGVGGAQRMSAGSSQRPQQGAGRGASVYGIVMYDFKAERPDELEAKEGEAIIVIAQSNPEWFVAKPITRLGGPGLIPVSFIEIRDMATGLPAADPLEAVRRAGVPKVEEWKKMAAEYKERSIPLGQFSAGDLSGGQQALQQGMARMSLNNQSQNPYGQLQQGNPYQQRGYPNGQNGARQPQPVMLAPVKASVPRYCFADDTFWFIVECQMEDGRHWELQRLYQDFYDLQINLIQEHPLEAGNVKGHERTLPYMPGPVTYVTDNISNGRRANLDEYIRNLLKLGPHITRSNLVRVFFAPREGDYEIDPNVATDDYRLSSASQDSPANPSNAASPQSSAGNLSQQGYSAAVSGRPGTATGHNPQGQFQHSRTPSQATTTTNRAPGAPLKIKVWFEPDNCVVIRMPAQFSYKDLYRKLKERRALERIDGEEDDAELEVCYRDEAEGRLYPIRGDEDLRVGMERNPERFTLSVRAQS
ncbi:uncharacterized protein PV09_03026 [Verruconis gallopava]|uniref:Bud emergence protein 1 n=1 Tax=Verruconis gallopava TaxID=253628 RepID=A0A0D2AGX1_9PEZI|nr:uncharacterized protein PV09_03026 [Verruconis gallopava]KIW05820.1 hypothetical protein PV09_03026 [Verruconis gallopava]